MPEVEPMSAELSEEPENEEVLEQKKKMKAKMKEKEMYNPENRRKLSKKDLASLTAIKHETGADTFAWHGFETKMRRMMMHMVEPLIETMST